MADLDLKIAVKPEGASGRYQVTGTTNLADRSRITVMSVRYLTPARTVLNQQPIASVLARQIVEVQKGQWQAQLNLWQPAADGQYQEAWQQRQSTLSIQPDPTVTFMALMEPAQQLPEIRSQLDQPTTKVSNLVVQFASDGERYMQVSQTLPVALPSGKTAPPSIGAAQQNLGWGNDRAQLPPPDTSKAQLSPPAETATDAPLTQQEWMR